MTITAAEATIINRISRGALNTELGTEVLAHQTSIASMGGDVSTLQSAVTTLQGVKHGAYTMVADDQTAGSKTINTTLTTIAGFIAQVYRAGILVASIKVTNPSAGNIKVETNSTDYVLATGDVFTWIAW